MHDLRISHRPPRTVRRTAAVVVAGLALGLGAACADAERSQRPSPTPSQRTPDRPALTATLDSEPDLGLPTQRTVEAAEREASLELALSPQRAEPQRKLIEAPRPAAAAPPRTVDRVRVTVADQRLQLLVGREVVREYPVSTAAKGAGARVGSQQTPLGLHRVHSKFGAGEPLGAIFEARRPTGEVAHLYTAPVDLPEDVITSRILWLEGLEPGKNRGKGIDSHARFIYIHGTNEEGLIGRPASHGCVRMRNRDVVELFELVATGTLVEILE